jgi:hypothetical protein
MSRRRAAWPDTSDKQPGESWLEYWGRKHDERHGPVCDCTWALAHGRGVPLPGQPLDTVPAGKRLVLWRGAR